MEQKHAKEGTTVTLDTYTYHEPEDPKVAKEEAEKPWNHRKLHKAIVTDNYLSYQDMMNMVAIHKSQLETAEKDLELLEEEKVRKREEIQHFKDEIKRWEDEVAFAEKDIPEIGEKAAAERKEDAELQKKHEENIKTGNAFEAK